MPAIPPILMNPIAPIAKPAPPGKTTQANAPQFAKDLFDEKEKVFMDSSTTSHTEDTTITLLSTFGFFKVFDYELPVKNAVTQRTVFFVNKESKIVKDTHGHIALEYLSILPDRSKIVDFPISNERLLKKNKEDRISRFSNYTLRWDHGTFAVVKELYLGFSPDTEGVLIAFNEEYDLGSKDLILTHWKSVMNSPAYKAFATSRGFRKAGTPTQILLHETVTKGNLAINAVVKDGNTFLIPHFCVNNIDANQKGNIIQYVDVAELTQHGEVMNDRSVGIEFVNTPVEAFEMEADGKTLKKDAANQTIPIFKLSQAKDGIYLNTVLKTIPYNKLFIPLEFSPDKADNNFELSIPTDKLINAAALKTLEINKIKIATETNKIVTIKYCKSEKFEHLVTLVKKLAEADILEIDLADFDNWKCNTMENDKEVFIFDKAFQNFNDGKGDLYMLDIRKKGIYCHGFTGHHGDGYLQALYTFLRIFKKLASHELALKKLIDLLINGSLVKIKRSVVTQFKDKTINDFSGSKDIEVSNCIVI